MRLLVATLLTGLVPRSALAQSALNVELLFPPAGAANVVVNAGLLLRVDDADPPSQAGEPSDSIVLRNASGEELNLGQISIAEHGGALYLATEPLGLAPHASYEVLTRLSQCSEAGRRTVCFGEELHPLADFRTGDVRDVTPPEIVSVTVVDALGCRWVVTVQAEDDHTPTRAVRYLALPAFGEPSPSWSPDGWLEFTTATVPEGEADVPVRLVPIDASGNPGAAFELPFTACPDIDFWGGESDITPFVADEVGSREAGSGCQISHAAGVPSGSALAFLALLLVAGCRAGQRRRSSRSGRYR